MKARVRHGIPSVEVEWHKQGTQLLWCNQITKPKTSYKPIEILTLLNFISVIHIIISKKSTKNVYFRNSEMTLNCFINCFVNWQCLHLNNICSFCVCSCQSLLIPSSFHYNSSEFKQTCTLHQDVHLLFNFWFEWIFNLYFNLVLISKKSRTLFCNWDVNPNISPPLFLNF